MTKCKKKPRKLEAKQKKLDIDQKFQDAPIESILTFEL